MAQKISTRPPSGFRDFFGEEAELRREVIQRIERAYTSFGFEALETPALERLETLIGSSGGENEKLIFKVLKRGEKLDEALNKNSPAEEELSDLALRFDMTVPLSRCATEYQSKIPMPWKVFHIGPVWRAERAQKGRYREFVQADVDIVGSNDLAAETEVLLAAIAALEALQVQGFVLKISDRRLLASLSSKIGFTDKQFEDFAIAVDKKDKLPHEKIIKELKSIEASTNTALIEKLLNSELSLEDCEKLNKESTTSIRSLISNLERAIDGSLKIEFDPSLARGLGYYTGSIFELHHPTEGYSFGGGGRYDQLIGRLSGKSLPAVGFSLGFERLIELLSKNTLGEKKPKVFVPVLDESDRIELTQKAAVLRSKGFQVDIFPDQAKAKAQFKYAETKGYSWNLLKAPNNERLSLEKADRTVQHELSENWLHESLRFLQKT